MASEKSLRWLPRPFLPTWRLGSVSILCLLESLLGSELPGCYFPPSSSASPLVHAQLARDRRKSPAGFGIPSSGFPLSFPRHGQPQTPRLSSWPGDDLSPLPLLPHRSQVESALRKSPACLRNQRLRFPLSKIAPLLLSSSVARQCLPVTVYNPSSFHSGHWQGVSLIQSTPS